MAAWILGCWINVWVSDGDGVAVRGRIYNLETTDGVAAGMDLDGLLFKQGISPGSCIGFKVCFETHC